MPNTITGLPTLPMPLSGNEVIYIKDPSRSPCDYQFALADLCAACLSTVSFDASEITLAGDVVIGGDTYNTNNNVQEVLEALSNHCCLKLASLNPNDPNDLTDPAFDCENQEIGNVMLFGDSGGETADHIWITVGDGSGGCRILKIKGPTNPILTP